MRSRNIQIELLQLQVSFFMWKRDFRWFKSVFRNRWAATHFWVAGTYFWVAKNWVIVVFG